jgi:Protein of unknown function (DUF2783)
LTAVPLNRQPNIADPDAFYEELIAAQRDLDDTGAEAFVAKMLLILANHVGDHEVLREAMALARAKPQNPAA